MRVLLSYMMGLSKDISEGGAKYNDYGILSIGMSAAVNTFHMPVFIALSGSLFALGKKLEAGTFIIKKAKRLLIPFFVVWLCWNMPIKYLTGYYNGISMGRAFAQMIFPSCVYLWYEYLVNGGKSCMAGFMLKNTLSDNGGVTRGICKMDEQNNLTEVVETKNIVKTATGAEADGVVVDVNSLVSMNMWGLTPDFLDVLENGFKEFFEKEVPSNPQKAEYLIPIFIGELLEQGKMSVKVLKTNDTWYGMTYHEDVVAVKDSFKKMLADGVYKADLFADL